MITKERLEELIKRKATIQLSKFGETFNIELINCTILGNELKWWNSHECEFDLFSLTDLYEIEVRPKREILFRGKRVDNGEWVEGFYSPLIWHPTKEQEPRIRDYNGSDIKIIPQTLGQYTGLCDKNGKKIFEGDILDDREENECVGVIVFEDGAFRVKWYRITTMLYPYGYDDAGFGEIETDHLDMFYIDKFEVIGNVFVNPELLGGND